MTHQRQEHIQLPEDNWVHGKDVEYLTNMIDTPFYVYNAESLLGAVDKARKVIGDNVPLYFSLKANPHPEVYNVLRKTGVRAEVSSAVELATVLEQGVPGKDILFLGPGKKINDIAMCLEHKVRIVVESFQEIDIVDSIARDKNITADVLLRINPSFQTKASGLRMGGAPRQFGIDEGMLLEDRKLKERVSHVHVHGVHVYMGTRFLDAHSIIDNTYRILEPAQRIAKIQNFPLEFVDVGGGWGVPYFPNEEPLELETLRKGFQNIYNKFISDNPNTIVAVELGRFLTAHAGALVTRVLYTKESMGKKFAILDGGTNIHMAAVGIGSFVRRDFPITTFRSQEKEGEEDIWCLTGPLCTPNDVVGKAVPLKEVQPGKVIIITRSGAYGASASPGLFLSHGFPSEILIEQDGQYKISPKQSVLEILRQRHSMKHQII